MSISSVLLFLFLTTHSTYSPKQHLPLTVTIQEIFTSYLELGSNMSPVYHFLTWFMVLRYLLKAVARTEERLVKTSTLRTLCTARRHNKPTKLLMNTPRKCRRNNAWPLCGDISCDWFFFFRFKRHIHHYQHFDSRKYQLSNKLGDILTKFP